jgi:predicted unusual protein kinase regulating ubiquinone biosynthesis (AarF/ABC1/UbiB family)
VNPRAYWRFLVVTWQFLPLLLSYARDRRRFLLFGRSRQVSPERRRRRAAKLLESMLTLGPTFIKLGQLLSTRPDVLPPEYIAEFAKLQDRVPPADWAEAEAVIEAELGPVEERFDSLDTEPISGASLGQVYEGSVDDQDVAVKVRRPGIQKLVEVDLRVVRWSVPILARFVDDVRSFSLETLADEFAKTIREEMDYEREAEMLQEICGNFRDNDTVRIPSVVETHSTEAVLTMEYVDGTKINNLNRLAELGIDRGELAERLQFLYLQMIMEDGVFHADPHPGNLAVADDGTLVLYDFGMSGYVDPYIQDNVVEFYTAVVREDFDAIIDALIEIGTLSPDADRELMREILDVAMTDLQGGDVDQYRIQQIIDQIENTIYEFPFRIPANLALVLRVATVVEGVCVALDPEFDFVEAAQRYFTREGYVEEGTRQYVRSSGEQVREAAGATVRVPPKLETVLDKMDRDDLQTDAAIRDPEDHFERLARRVVLGVVFSAGVVSTTALWIARRTTEAALGAVLTALVGYLLYRSFQTGITLYAQSDAQFTRQRLQDRDEEETAMGFGQALTDEDGDPVAHEAMPTPEVAGESAEPTDTEGVPGDPPGSDRTEGTDGEDSNDGADDDGEDSNDGADDDGEDSDDGGDDDREDSNDGGDDDREDSDDGRDDDDETPGRDRGPRDG